MYLGIENYKVHKKRRNGKAREVYEPNEFLRNLQVEAVKAVFSKYSVSSCSMAYELNCSTRKNAEAHQSAKYLAAFDIKDFYGSIRFWHFEKLLMSRYDSLDIKLLWRICSLNDALPVGAYSSSFISNRIMYELDNALRVKFFGVKYTRYADDLVFSSFTPLPPALERDLVFELSQFRFELNQSKTRTFDAQMPKKVTGITITSDNRLTVGKKYKLRLKKRLYDYINKGRGNRLKLIGKLRYVKHIEPEYFERLRVKYDLDRTIFSKAGGSDANANEDGRTYAQRFVDEQYSRRVTFSSAAGERDVRVNRSRNSRSRAAAPTARERVIAIILAVVVFFAGYLMGYLNRGDSQSEGEIIPPVVTTEITKYNYTEYITITRGYGIYSDKTEFSIHIINQTSYIIKDLVINFFVLSGNSIIYMDTIHFETLGKIPKTVNFVLNKEYPSFSSFEFQYSNVTGLLTSILS